MPVPAPIVFANGTAMVAADVEANLDDIRTDWLNGAIASTEVVDNNIQTQHLYGKDYIGFPLDGAYGRWGDQWTRESYRDTHEVYEQDHRTDMFDTTLHSNDRTPIPGLGWTGRLKASTYVEITMWCEAFEIHNNTAGGGYLNNSGWVSCWIHDRAGGTYTEFTPSRLRLITDTELNTGHAASARKLHSYAWFSSGDGVFDIFWAYRRGPLGAIPAGTNTRQIIFGHRGMIVEHHHR